MVLIFFSPLPLYSMIVDICFWTSLLKDEGFLAIVMEPLHIPDCSPDRFRLHHIVLTPHAECVFLTCKAGLAFIIRRGIVKISVLQMEWQMGSKSLMKSSSG